MEAQAFERLVRRQVALAASDGFHVLARALRLARDVDVAREQRDAQQLGQLRHEARIVVGVLTPQLMVDMQHGQLPERTAFAQLVRQVGKRRGIRAPRHHQQRRRIRPGQSARGKRRLHARDKIVRVCHHTLPSKNLRSNSSSGSGRPNRKP